MERNWRDLLFGFQPPFSRKYFLLKTVWFIMSVSHFQCLQLAKHSKENHNSTILYRENEDASDSSSHRSEKCNQCCLELEVCRLQSSRHIWPATCFWVKFYWPTAIHICLHIICGCFWSIITEALWLTVSLCVFHTVFTENIWWPHVKQVILALVCCGEDQWDQHLKGSITFYQDWVSVKAEEEYGKRKVRIEEKEND